VSALFQSLAPGQSPQSAQNAAAEALMLADRNANSRLDVAEFQQLVKKWVCVGCESHMLLCM
jgi:hypothetical protein